MKRAVKVYGFANGTGSRRVSQVYQEQGQGKASYYLDSDDPEGDSELTDADIELITREMAALGWGIGENKSRRNDILLK